MHELRFGLATTVVAVVASSQLLMAEAATGGANCTTRCGDVSVPYPFGIGSGCHLAGFNLTCNTSYVPPRLFLGDGRTLEVLDISLDDSTMRVRGPQGATDMQGSIPGGSATNGSWGGLGWGLSDDAPYVLSEQHNELLLSGCSLFVELLVSSSHEQISSCASICISEDPLIPQGECFKTETPSCKRCTGVICCQAPIPLGRIA
ncbi:unnamed protein product [Urochloa decumbens]|uniref:Wall-associated receptor kinase galacturonan-binding domain-containing protein n=1 Tax=Urochloa decumbens TaxID=240449 RepID=A0ABC9AT33_9POAL